MNSSRRVENAQKAAVPLNNYEFDFGLGSVFSGHQPSKSLKDQKQHHTPNQPSTAPAWTPNKPSWTPQPSPAPAPRPGQAGLSSGWSGQSGFSSGWSGQSQPAPMVGDIFGKSWAKPDSSKLRRASGIVGGATAGDANLFGDLVGAALGQQKSRAPLNQVSTKASVSMGSVDAALPKRGTPLKDLHNSAQSVEEFGDFADEYTGKKHGDPVSDSFDAFPSSANTNVHAPQKDPFGSFVGSSAEDVPHQSGSTVIQDPFVSSNNEKKFGDFENVSGPKIPSEEPFGSVNNDDIFGEFQKGSTGHASVGGGDPFAASLNVPADLFGGASKPNSSNAGDPFADFTFGATGGGSGGVGFTDPLSSFSAPQGKGKDPLDSLVSSASASTSGGLASQPFSQTDDWGLDTGFGGDNGVTTTELEGLPPPPAGVTAAIAKDKGMENYKQGQFADAIKWLSWSMALLEKGGSVGAAAVEILTCRASCYKEVGEYKKAVSDCSKVLDHDNSNVSVLLQRALLYESTEKYKLGVEDLRNVLKIDPGNRLAKSTLSRLVKMAD